MKTRSRTYRLSRTAQKDARTRTKQRKAGDVRVTRAMASKRPRMSNNLSREGGQASFQDRPHPITSNLSTTTRDSVFGTVELLEQILSYLPFRSLFLCQTICRHFRSVIAQSSQIQKSLWLNCSEAPDHQQWTFSNQLVQNDGGMRLLCPGEEAPLIEGFPTTVFTPARMCPLIQRQPYLLANYNEAVRQNSALRIRRLKGEGIRLDLELLESFTVPFPQRQPSWYQVQVSKPPSKKADIDLHFILVREFPKSGTWQVGEMSVKKSVQNHSKGGLKMGDLVRLDVPEEILSWSINGRYYTKIKDPARLVARMEKRYKAKMYLAWDSYRPSLVLDGLVFPFDEEWRRVEGSL